MVKAFLLRVFYVCMFFIDDYRRRSGAGQGQCFMMIGVGFDFDIR